MSVGEFKSRFSEALNAVRNGESITVTFGRKKKAVAIVDESALDVSSQHTAPEFPRVAAANPAQVVHDFPILCQVAVSE